MPAAFTYVLTVLLTRSIPRKLCDILMYLLHINNYVKQIFDDKLTASGTIAYFKAWILVYMKPNDLHFLLILFFIVKGIWKV